MTHGSKRAKYVNTQLFNRFRVSAYFGILAVFSIVAILNNFKSKWAPPVTAHDTQSYVARITLFSVLVLLAIRWVIATDREFKLWTRVLENPAEKWEFYVAIFSLSIILGFCLAFAFDIVKVSIAFTIYLLINYWSQWLSNDHFSRALPETRKKAKDAARQSVLNVLELYWLKKAQLARITTMMFFSSLAFSLAWAGSFAKEPQKYWFDLDATIVLVVNIVLGEILIGIWRYKRNKGIKLAENSPTIIPIRQPKFKAAAEAYKGRFDTARQAAYWGVLVVFGIVASLNDFKSIWTPTSWDSTGIFAAGIILFLELSALAYRWVLATSNEMELWLDQLDNPMTKQQVQGAIICLAIALGFLLAFAHNIVFVSGFIAIYFLINYWTQWLSNDHFCRALEKTRRAPLDDAKIKILDGMEQYWLRRPQLVRITTMMFFASLAFSLALAGWVQPEPQRAPYYLASYTVLFLDILIGEAVIFVWRRSRDKQINLAIDIEG